LIKNKLLLIHERYSKYSSKRYLLIEGTKRTVENVRIEEKKCFGKQVSIRRK
jgi:hypothetical protein